MGAHTEGAEVAVQDVGAVAGAVHPGVHHGVRVGLAAGYVLAGEVAIPGLGRAVPGVRAVRVGVGEEAAVRHVLAEVLGQSGQFRVRGERATARAGPLLVHQLQHPGLGDGLLEQGGRRAGRGAPRRLGREGVGSGLLLGVVFGFFVRGLGRAAV